MTFSEETNLLFREVGPYAISQSLRDGLIKKGFALRFDVAAVSTNKTVEANLPKIVKNLANTTTTVEVEPVPVGFGFVECFDGGSRGVKAFVNKGVINIEEDDFIF